MSQQTARDIDIATRQSEGVDDGSIKDAEGERGTADFIEGRRVELHIASGGGALNGIESIREHILTDRIGIVRDAGIVQKSVLSDDLLVGLLAELDLLSPRIGATLPLSGDEVDVLRSAACEQEREEKKRQPLAPEEREET